MCGGVAILLMAALVRAGQQPVHTPNTVERGAGEQIYISYCSGCHLPSGRGSPPVVPALAGNAALGDGTHVIRSVRNGRGIMPPFGRLGAGELAAVASYIRNSWGNAFGDLTSAAVGDVLNALAAPAATNAGASPSAWFTAEQAGRGKELYLERCAECHGAAFVPDDFAPGLTGAAFDWRWAERTVYDLFAVIRTTMPPGEGGSLGPNATIDIVSYLLQVNGFPEGSMELRDEPDALRRLRLRR